MKFECQQQFEIYLLIFVFCFFWLRNELEFVKSAYTNNFNKVGLFLTSEYHCQNEAKLL